MVENDGTRLLANRRVLEEWQIFEEGLERKKRTSAKGWQRGVRGLNQLVTVWLPSGCRMLSGRAKSRAFPRRSTRKSKNELMKFMRTKTKKMGTP
jgi:hypothetical protein